MLNILKYEKVNETLKQWGGEVSQEDAEKVLSTQLKECQNYELKEDESFKKMFI